MEGDNKVKNGVFIMNVLTVQQLASTCALLCCLLVTIRGLIGLSARFRAENQYQSSEGLILILKFFQVPERSIQSIGSKLAMRIFHEYANILKCMYSTRFNGGSTGTGISLEAQPAP
jgi:hypothetical protein